MKKIIYIAPHLSTGGLPQYLTKKIELLKDMFDIYVIEYEDVTGGSFVVQKDRIKNLIGEKLITIPWGGDKTQILSHIKAIKPDIIHMEEIPEYFMDFNIAKEIYNQNRTYKIFETSHDSSVDTNNKKFLPDKFILVSNFQIGMMSKLNIPSEVVEYPIEYKERPNRREALIKLGLDPNKTHVLHVGLFTPRKNQAEFFEYAKVLSKYDIEFHSVGNLADNFRTYWEPLLENKPDNVIIHGEKSNVDDYYAAMDLFLFTSRGTINDKETMPLVIREAISWSLPTLIYNLPVYENYFDKYKGLIDYLDFNSFENNYHIILDKLKIKKFSSDYKTTEETHNIGNGVNKDDTILIISTYPNNRNVISLTKKSIKYAKSFGYKVMLVSHYPVSDDLQKMCDYYIYDANNILTKHDFYARYWEDNSEFYVNINLKNEDNDVYHGPAVYTNYYNGISLANKLGFSNAVCLNFDVLLKNENLLNKYVIELSHSDAVFNISKASEGDILRTVTFATKTQYFIDNFRKINNQQDYNQWKNEIQSESNGLENMFYHTLKNKLKNISLLTDDVYFNLLNGCEIDLCSRVEYFTILSIPDNNNIFVVWLNNSNVIDDRNVTIEIDKNGINIDNFEVTLKTKQYWYYGYNFSKDDAYTIQLIENGDIIKTIIVNDDYMKNKLNNNGYIKIKL